MTDRDDREKREDRIDWTDLEQMLQGSAPDMPEGTMIEGPTEQQEWEEAELFLSSSSPDSSSGAMSETRPDPEEVRRRLEILLSSASPDAVDRAMAGIDRPEAARGISSLELDASSPATSAKPVGRRWNVANIVWLIVLGIVIFGPITVGVLEYLRNR